MTGRAGKRWLVLLCLVVCLPLAAQAQRQDNAVWLKVREIVRERFYDPERAASFGAEKPGGEEAATDDAIAQALAGLGASHTARFEPDQIAYFELMDVFRFAVRDDIKRLFPPEGRVTYAGIGMVAAEIDGRLFATDVYDAGPAARAGVREGDEILAVEGEPYHEIGSFEDKVGRKVSVRLRRTDGAEPVEVPVEVEAIRPNAMFTASVAKSARTFERNGRTIGYIRLWSFTSRETEEALARALSSGRLKDADGLVLDLRSRWGGAPPDAAEIFVGGTPATQFIGRRGRPAEGNVRWRKPVVAIIDEGTRSGLEIFAYALQQNGVPLVGTRTAGAVLAGTAFILPDDSMLEVAVADVITDGKRLEGEGVSPDVTVARDIRFANGADPQLDAALEALAGRL